jgi:ligand-binding sensor domain-containing protein/signal transduction histidine kinase
MSRASLFGLVFSLLGAPLWAQDFAYSTRNYTAIDGLPQSQVLTIVEDKSGYLWIGTAGGGLARFDGREFKVYTTLDGLLTNEIIGLRFDTHDNLWILHPMGITRFDGLNFKKIHLPADKLRNVQLWPLFPLGDTVFVSTNFGLTGKILNDSLKFRDNRVSSNNELKLIQTTPAGEICLYFSDSSLVVKSIKETFSLKIGSETGRVFSMFSFKGDLALQSTEGLFRLDTKNRKIQKLALEIPHRILLHDKRKDVFWTSKGGTLFKESLRNEILVRDTVLKNTSINQVLIDSEGNTWLASNGRGLFKYFVQDFDQSSLAKNSGVMAILKDREGATWVGTMDKGLWKIVGGKLHSYNNSYMPYRTAIHSIKESADGTIWVGAAFGLGRYDRKNDSFYWFSKEDGLPGFAVSSIAFDENGMWIGTGNGLGYFNGKSFRTFRTKDGLSANGIWALHYCKRTKTLFIGTDAALNTLKDGQIGVVSISAIANTSILSINGYADSLLVVGTGGTGVVILDPRTFQQKFITTREGLASDFVYFAAADEKDYLWIGTEKGINRIRLDRQLEIDENLHFDYNNGLTGVETNQNAFYLSPKGKYFGLVDGLYEYNALNKESQRSFDVHLTDIRILYGEYSPREFADSTFGFFKIPFQPSLPPDRNHVTFHFNRVDKRYSKSVKYKYYLQNFDKTWSQPSSVNEVTYSNLPSGEYTFRVMSTNNKGSWSDTQIAYDFVIKAPFYQTASFLVGLFILLGGLITLTLYIRVQQRVKRIVMLEHIRQKEQENLRKEIARDFHDEMGNQLTRIINYVSLLKLNGQGSGNGTGNGTSNGMDLYTKVEDSAKYLYTGTRDFIWAIDPVNDELSKLFIHIRDFGEKLFEEKAINFRAFNEVREKIKLPYGFSREANLIFKEVMTNAFKSSHATNVTLTLRRDEKSAFEMSFEDDGIGFDTDDIEKSNGLKNIYERSSRINAVLRIRSVKNEGTKIVLSFALTKTLKYGLAF